MHSLMGSETQVVQLQELLEATEVEAAGMERELDDYEAVLHRARIARAPVSEKSASLIIIVYFVKLPSIPVE